MKQSTVKTKAKKDITIDNEKSVLMQIFEKQVKIFSSAEVALFEAVFSKSPNILNTSFIYKLNNTTLPLQV